MSNITITNIDNGSLIVNVEQTDFEDGLLTFADADDFAAGTLLARSAEKFILATAAGNVVAVLPYAVSRGSAGDTPIRALVSGTINKDRILFDNATAITAAVVDALRNYSIVAVDVAQLSNVDNPQP